MTKFVIITSSGLDEFEADTWTIDPTGALVFSDGEVGATQMVRVYAPGFWKQLENDDDDEPEPPDPYSKATTAAVSG